MIWEAKDLNKSKSDELQGKWSYYLLTMKSFYEQNGIINHWWVYNKIKFNELMLLWVEQFYSFNVRTQKSIFLSASPTSLSFATFQPKKTESKRNETKWIFFHSRKVSVKKSKHLKQMNHNVLKKSFLRWNRKPGEAFFSTERKNDFEDDSFIATKNLATLERIGQD